MRLIEHRERPGCSLAGDLAAHVEVVSKQVDAGHPHLDPWVKVFRVAGYLRCETARADSEEVL